MPFARREGLRLHYVESGTGDPPVVFVHGWSCDHTYFAPQIEHFSRTRRTVGVDLRGHGSSDVPDEGYGIDSFADDVAWLCGELGLARPVIVGHSMGGVIALDLAARRPELPSAVVLVDPAPIGASDQMRGMFKQMAGAIRGPESVQMRRGFVDGMFLPTDDTELKGRVLDGMSAVPAHVAAAALEGMGAWDGVAAAKAVTVPTLVLLASPVGGNSPARIAELMPAASVGVTVGAGHFHQLVVPDQVTAMVDRFLATAT